MRRLKTVGDVLGPEGVRKELMPYLETIADDDDELLLALAGELGKFVPVVGGKSQACCLLPCLEYLTRVEETVVREKAVESTCSVIEAADGGEEEIVAMLKRLTSGDWFTSRVSACGLYAAVYSHTKNAETLAGLRSGFETLAKDETPMVRRAAASKLGKFCMVMEGVVAVNELLPVLQGLISDDQDSVRQLAVDNLSKVAMRLMEENCSADCNTHVLPLVKQAAQDLSWRVRFALAKGFSELANAMGSEVTSRDLAPHLIALLQDQETEVTVAICKEMATYVDLIGSKTFAAQIMPHVGALADDVNLSVRAALSKSCMLMAPKLGEENTRSLILPMLEGFLTDENAEVRLHVLNNLEALAEWMPSMASQLLPLVQQLGHDGIWRVRKAVIESIPLLTERMGVQCFEENLLEMYLGSYQDSVSEVRHGAASGLSQLCKVFGSDWLSEKIFPRIRSLYAESNLYLIRISVLNAVAGLIPAAAGTDLANDGLEMLLSGTRDRVPNVRFTSVRALHQVASDLENETVSNQVRPCLVDLESDEDTDVQLFAKMALESLG
ncbi:unnamed protein product [Chrysoparadoxa australica]